MLPESRIWPRFQAVVVVAPLRPRRRRRVVRHVEKVSEVRDQHASSKFMSLVKQTRSKGLLGWPLALSSAYLAVSAVTRRNGA
jgi:hypothetical protein